MINQIACLKCYSLLCITQHVWLQEATVTNLTLLVLLHLQSPLLQNPQTKSGGRIFGERVFKEWVLRLVMICCPQDTPVAASETISQVLRLILTLRAQEILVVESQSMLVQVTYTTR